MDQLKEYLKLAVKYRFWIVVGVAALLPMIGYFASAGPINEEADTKAGTVKSAYNNVKQYESGLLPNSDWQTLTEERTGVLKSEISKAWDLLYKQQEYLLTWPEEVSDKYTTWGPQWPEDVSPSEVTLTNNTYGAVYPDYVERVYNTVRPFNYTDGTGIVVAPAKESLLRPAKFSASRPPTLGKVWAAQQKLWIQNVVLDIIDKVNSNAESWDIAPIKQITGLEVASPKAQDQKSIIQGIQLVPAPEIVRPGTETAATAAPAASPGGGGLGMDGDTEGYAASMMRGGSSGYGGGMAGGGGAQSDPDEVYIFEQTTGQQFREVPVYMAVLIEQSRVLDLIEAFRRSPMSIQVVDFELKKPSIKVERPEKGQQNPGFSSLMGLGEMMYGGNSMMGEYGRMGAGSGGMGAGYPGMGGRGGAAAPKKPQGTDIASDQYKKLQEKAQAKEKGKEEDSKKDASKSSFSDPYFNIVEVHIYGRARFYDQPPVEAAQPESFGADDTFAADGEILDGQTPAAPLDDLDMQTPAAPLDDLDIETPAAPLDDLDDDMPVTETLDPGADLEATPAPEPDLTSRPGF